jgi:hypothetical protein
MKYYFVPLLLAAAAGVAAAQNAPAAPITIVVEQYTFAPVGTTYAYLRVNVANLSGGTSVCTGSVSFIDSTGKTIPGPGGSLNVAAGQTSSFEFVPQTAVSGAVRGFVTINHQVGGVVGPMPVMSCNALMSLEVVNSINGQTQAVLTNPTPISGIPLVTPFPGTTTLPQ